MKNTKSKDSALPTYLLMGGVLTLGIGAAFMVLSKGDTKPTRTPAPAVSAVAPVAARPAVVVVPKAAVTPAPAPAVASAPDPAPVAPVAAATPAVPAVVGKVDKAGPPPAPVVAKAAEPIVVPVKVEQPAPAPVVPKIKTAPKPKEREAKRVVVRPVRAAPPAPVKTADLPRMALPEMPVTPQITREAPTQRIESPEPVKPVYAAPLTATMVKPVVVLATQDRAWVRLTDQKTVIVNKGQALPELGVYRGTDGKAAKFDSGAMPINP